MATGEQAKLIAQTGRCFEPLSATTEEPTVCKARDDGPLSGGTNVPKPASAAFLAGWVLLRQGDLLAGQARHRSHQLLESVADRDGA